MKKITLLFLVLLVTKLGFSQNADEAILLETIPGTVYLGDTSRLKITVSNFGTTDLITSSLRILVSCPPNGRMVGLVPDSSSNKFSLVTAQSTWRDSANTFVLVNTGGPIPAGTHADIYIYLKAVNVGQHGLTGNIAFNIENIGVNITQGNISTENDNSRTDFKVLPSNTLPIHFISIDGKWKQNNAVINWHVAGETDGDHYKIERSFDSKNFVSIGSVNYDRKASNNGKYSFVDKEVKNTVNGQVYYRIVQTGADNSTATTDIISLASANQLGSKPSLYPNPVMSDRFTFEYQSTEKQDAQIKIDITDALGRSVLKTTLPLQSGTNQLPIQTVNLSAGAYYFNYYNERTQDKGSIKFIKKYASN